ncbi:GMC family oxidoreductase [Rhizobium sp. TH2]|uniref:GMC oxidoreductase n=1 Tax=Rhizobium sp. TH2 TaxID=2775403 RepID=UPI0021572B7C|nr:GMC family oxidoreductase [Rhizobium sp. TH2]UVC07739.1 GMC family oxidoreductase [Rhizobium sp. TH2]
MAITNLRNAPRGLELHTDIAIVGGGPAGLAIARELSGTRIRVMVIDSGGFEVEDSLDTLNRVENVGATNSSNKIGRGYSGPLTWLNDVPPFELRHRGLGGSTRTWIGKCAAFDEIDFEKRSWVPGSGWPVSLAELKPHLDRAAELLNLGPNVYDRSLYNLLRSAPRLDISDDDMVRPFFWQFSHEPGSRGEPMRFRRIARRIDGPNIDFLTHATATRIDTVPNGTRVHSVTVRNDEGGHAIVYPSVVVLCSGGIENARLLLISNAIAKKGLGNDHGVVGRYLADHPRTVLARFPAHAIQRVSEIFTFYGLADRHSTNFYLHGLTLSPAVQRREGLLNCAAYPVQTLSHDDPWLALRRLASTPGRASLADLSSILRSPVTLANGLIERFVHRRGLPRKASELRFDVMVEQRPNPQSRVMLSRTKDAHQVPLPKVNWRISDHEVHSIRRFAELTAIAFSRAGLPEPLLPDWVIQQATKEVPFADMAHPSGTTRMGSDVKSSVVDANCMVHGVEGLFIAGSSVFPTAGHANPTLMIIALALRLADHLRGHQASAADHGVRADKEPIKPVLSGSAIASPAH